MMNYRFLSFILFFLLSAELLAQPGTNGVMTDTTGTPHLLQGKEKNGIDVYGKFKGELIAISMEMIDIISKVQTVEQALAAEPRIEESMKGITHLAEEIDSNFSELAAEDFQTIADLGRVMDDPDVSLWTARATEMMLTLEKENATAALKLQQLSEKYSTHFVKVMESLVLRIRQLRGEVEPEGMDFDP